MLAIWSLAPLPFLNPAWTSGSSRFMYCWRLQVEHYFTSDCLHTCNLNFVIVVQSLSHDWMNCSKPDFPILHHLLEFAQTQVHWVNDATQPSHPCPPVLNLSQHQGLSSELAFHIRWPKFWSFSFSISPFNEYSGLIPIGLTGLISLLPKGLSRASPAPQFKTISSSVLSLLYGPTLASIHDYWKNHNFWLDIPFLAMWHLCF